MPFLGYLPQDMLGKCVLEFYHPEDMPFIKDIYQTGEADNYNMQFL
jgi:period circadian protein